MQTVSEGKDVLTAVGQRYRRVDVLEKLTGRAQYAVDVRLPGMLYGRYLGSRYAHARIVRIDVTGARAVPGVVAVVTGQEIAGRQGPSLKDQPLLAVEKVRFVGEPVAAVAAIDARTAQRALDRIVVEYEELPALYDPIVAAQPGAPLIHEHMASYPRSAAFHPIPGTNVCDYFRLRKGDVEVGFAAADHVFEDTFHTGTAQHCSIEPHAATAVVDAGGKITLWAGNQAPYLARGLLAEALGVPLSQIRVIVPYLGGGFGGKWVPKIEAIAVALARHTDGRPVRLVCDRDEEFAVTVKMGCSVKIKTGVTAGGTLVARKAEIYWDLGGYAGTGPAIVRNSGFAALGPYVIPHAAVDAYAVYTNKPSCGGFRGFGIPEVAWAYESQMDIIARRLGVDPLSLRLQNAVEDGSLSITGEVLESVGLKESLERAADAIAWGERERGVHGSTKRRGKGLACIYKATSTPSSSAAFVKVNEDGTVNVLKSAIEMGQGVDTVLVQIAAEELGVRPERVSISHADTDLTPYERSSSSSRNTFNTGNAVRAAAIDARQQMVAIASEMLEAAPDDLEVRDGEIYVRGAPDKKLRFADLWGAGAYVLKAQQPILGRGTFHTGDHYESPDPETGQSARPTAFWTYAAQAAEVEVDTETGQVTVLKMTAAHDAGKAINPLGCEQQIEGSIGMGLGTSLWEEVVLDTNGRIVNPTFMDYKLPTALDMPEMESILVEKPHPRGPFGAKGIGEPGLAPTGAAIANAVADAVGVRLMDLPLTPERVLWALKEWSARTDGEE